MKRSYVRLTEPLVRDGGGLRPATWEEALDRVATGFRLGRGTARTADVRPVQLLEGHQ